MIKLFSLLPVEKLAYLFLRFFCHIDPYKCAEKHLIESSMGASDVTAVTPISYFSLSLNAVPNELCSRATREEIDGICCCKSSHIGSYLSPYFLSPQETHSPCF